jgi:hypothetical protein
MSLCYPVSHVRSTWALVDRHIRPPDRKSWSPRRSIAVASKGLALDQLRVPRPKGPPRRQLNLNRGICPNCLPKETHPSHTLHSHSLRSPIHAWQLAVESSAVVSPRPVVGEQQAFLRTSRDLPARLVNHASPHTTRQSTVYRRS